MKKISKNILFFIPSYNDTKNAFVIARSIKKIFPKSEVLVIDDGSNEVFFPKKGDQFKFFSTGINFGLGVCTHIAIDFMLNNKFDILVRLDADGQHPIREIGRLVKPILNEQSDYSVGIRMNHYSVKKFLIRDLIKKYYNFVARIISNNKVPSDVNSGFFAINRMCAESINNLQLERYPEPETYIHLSRQGFILSESKIVQNKRNHNKSTLNFFNGLRMFYKFNIVMIYEIFRSKKI